MILSIIVAMTPARVIGKDNGLPWHLSEDLKRFKQITMGHPIVMGRKTFESIGRPLPGRHNIVLSRRRPLSIPGVTIAHSLDDAIKIFYNEGRGREELFVIGGAKLFDEAYPRADRLYLTLVDGSFDGDAFFPDVDWRGDFDVVESVEGRDGKSGVPFKFITARRKVTGADNENS